MGSHTALEISKIVDTVVRTYREQLRTAKVDKLIGIGMLGWARCGTCYTVSALLAR
jgi:hypothetical protein